MQKIQEWRTKKYTTFVLMTVLKGHIISLEGEP